MNRKRWAAILCGGVCVLVVVCSVAAGSSSGSRGEVQIDPTKLYAVSAVLDGDTFKAKVGWRDITVRMLGIDTPETVDPRKPVGCFGIEASVEAKRLLAGHSVRLEANPNRERRDRYGRYLLYAYLDDGSSVNESLLTGGFAREYTFGKPYSFQARFRKMEAEARSAKAGLWGACDNPKSS